MWRMRNDIIFGAGQDTVKGSGKFLENYVETLGAIKKKTRHAGRWRVDLVMQGAGTLKPRREDEDGQLWRPPQEGWVKLNTDAGFCPIPGKASTGIVLRGPSGDILLRAWRSIRACGSPEAEACLQGVRLVAHNG
jgi:hypothetical protein